LEQAGLTLADVPGDWEAFWSFWCDRVQPALRKATGRNDLWGVGLPAGTKGDDTESQFRQFVAAYQADYVTRDGRLVIDDPEVRRQLVKAIDSYTSLYRKGCVPPDAMSWGNIDDNRAFLAQRVVMTANLSLSIVNALKHERQDDYYRNVVTIEWPLGLSGELLPIVGGVVQAVAFERGGNVAAAKEFVRFFIGEGWLAHYLNLSGERLLPSMLALLDQPFWLDPRDPHHMAAIVQAKSRSLAAEYALPSSDLRHNRIWTERVWAKVIERIITEGLTPEQAADEAIARIKQILSE
jgi:multiple sugar transport system substrate-binding protein